MIFVGASFAHTYKNHDKSATPTGGISGSVFSCEGMKNDDFWIFLLGYQT
jgi:hypothetical protein